MRQAKRAKPEPTIALINIVFLMLVFFLVAGTLAQPLDGDLSLVKTKDIEQAPPPDALVVGPEGDIAYRGEAVGDLAVFVAQSSATGEEADADPTIRIVPDRDLPAAQLLDIGRALREAGAGRIMIVTERGLE